MESAKTLTTLPTEMLEKVAFVLKTIAHPMRIGIVNLLTYNERLTVTELCEALGAEQPLVSHHLSTMRLKGILDSERQGKNIFYSLKIQEVTKVIACMENCQLKEF